MKTPCSFWKLTHKVKHEGEWLTSDVDSRWTVNDLAGVDVRLAKLPDGRKWVIVMFDAALIGL